MPRHLGAGTALQGRPRPRDRTASQVHLSDANPRPEPAHPSWVGSQPAPSRRTGRAGQTAQPPPTPAGPGPAPPAAPFLPGEGSYLFLSPVLPRVALSGKASPLLSGTVRNCSGLTTGKPRFFYQNTVSDTIPRPPHCVCCGKPALPVSTLWRRHTPPLSPQGASQTPVYSRGPGSTPNAGAGDMRPQCPAPHGAAPATESRLRAPWDPPMTCNLALCVSQGSRGRSSRRE